MLQRQFGVLIAGIALVCSLMVALPSLADSNARIVRLSYINGDAQINHNEKDEGFTHAILNMPVTTGMWLYTPLGARAEVQFENGSTVRMVEDAQLQFEKLALAKSGGKIDTINIDHGIVYLNFSKVAKDDQIQVNLAGRTLRISKPAHLRLEVSDKIVAIASLHGQATLEGDFVVDVKEGHTLMLNPENTDQFKMAKGTDKYGSDMWDKNRDDQLTAQYTTHSNGLLNSSGYDAQYASLGYYGNFVSVPGFGNAWQPSGVGPGWDPFSNGMWGFYPGMGYMFISTYPWGWAPYRYGQWNYMSNYGWFWSPGGATTAFNVGPRFGTVPAGWNAPAQPAVGGSVKTNQYVVVGNPPNVHPTILQGHPTLNTHPAPALTPVRSVSMNQHGNVAARNSANRGGMLSPNSGASSHANHAGSGPAVHSSGGVTTGVSHSSSGSVGGMGGHPK